MYKKGNGKNNLIINYYEKRDKRKIPELVQRHREL